MEVLGGPRPLRMRLFGDFDATLGHPVDSLRAFRAFSDARSAGRRQSNVAPWRNSGLTESTSLAALFRAKGVIRVSRSGPFSVRFRFVSNIACLFSTTWWLRSYYLYFLKTVTFFIFNNILASLVLLHGFQDIVCLFSNIRALLVFGWYFFKIPPLFPPRRRHSAFASTRPGTGDRCGDLATIRP